MTRLAWLGIVLLWFWPITLTVLGGGVLGYLAYGIWALWPGANW